jgi:hypothetical protein
MGGNISQFIWSKAHNRFRLPKNAVKNKKKNSFFQKRTGEVVENKRQD